MRHDTSNAFADRLFPKPPEQSTPSLVAPPAEPSRPPRRARPAGSRSCIHPGPLTKRAARKECARPVTRQRRPSDCLADGGGKQTAPGMPVTANPSPVIRSTVRNERVDTAEAGSRAKAASQACRRAAEEAVRGRADHSCDTSVIQPFWVSPPVHLVHTDRRTNWHHSLSQTPCQNFVMPTL